MDEPRRYPFPRPTALGIPEQIVGVHGEPLLPVVLPSGDHAVLLTRYQDVRQILTDDRLSRNLNRPDAARISRSNSMFQDASTRIRPSTRGYALWWPRRSQRLA